MKALGGQKRPSSSGSAEPVKKKSAGAWALGTRVKHAKYGYGTILRTEGSGDDLKLTVSFIGHG
jgi:DNA helicase-2/ATP-dependent DNA helicase PcrA